MNTLTIPVTADNFMEVANLPEFADQNIELVEGEIAIMPATNPNHAEILGVLTTLVGSYIRRHQLGRYYVGDVGTLLQRSAHGRDTVRGLDFAFISQDRAPARSSKSLLEITPDLAIEVMSPSNSGEDMRFKVRQLLKAGTREVWVVYPDLREVDVHNAEGDYIFREGDTISGGDILPGFEIAVVDIFPS